MHEVWRLASPGLQRRIYLCRYTSFTVTSPLSDSRVLRDHEQAQLADKLFNRLSQKFMNILSWVILINIE
jgi:hypothetical protein